ncbi:MAG TPA: methylmalonyl-CoA mutase family protein [Conexivisphaerales archaeon]|nr:methylmalonyl-CoA mutase family protein [Conexivisphaerales archaeon]
MARKAAPKRRKGEGPDEEALKKWESEVLANYVAASPERQGTFLSEDGPPVPRLATPMGLEREGWDYLARLGFPGSYPFTRGVYPTMYRGRQWTIRQYAGFGSAEDTNSRYRYLLKAGQTGLSVAFDLPTQLGLDPDDELAYYEVGKVGVSLSNIREMEMVFDSIPLAKVSTSMTINATAMELLALYATAAEAQAVEPSGLRGTVQNDILKEYIARNNFIYPPVPSMRYSADIIAHCAKAMPQWNSISISGYHFEEAGATPSQEVGFTLADGIEYIREVARRGIEVDDFAQRLSFFFASRTGLVEQVAKFRAARRMWAKIMKERFGARDPKSMALRFHAQTAGVTMTAQQPQVNIIRITLQALAAALGGAQSLHVNSYDEAISLPTEEAVKLSVRVQQALMLESGIADSVDPLGGSYLLEELTDSIEDRAWRIVDDVEKMGGMVKAIERGYPQKEIARSAYDYQLKVESGEIPVIGVNVLREEEKGSPEPLRIDPASRSRVIRRVKEFRESRDASAVKAALARLEKAASAEDNLFPVVTNCVRSKCTVGEISGTLRETWGEWTQ